MRQELSGKGDVNGVISHTQPLAGCTVFYLHTDGVDGYHENQQHQYARCKSVAQIDGIVQPRIVQWVRVDDDGL